MQGSCDGSRGVVVGSILLQGALRQALCWLISSALVLQSGCA